MTGPRAARAGPGGRGRFHLLFNLACVAAGLPLIELLAALARWSGGEVANQVVNLHLAFNLAGSAVFPSFTDPSRDCWRG